MRVRLTDWRRECMASVTGFVLSLFTMRTDCLRVSVRGGAERRECDGRVACVSSKETEMIVAREVRASSCAEVVKEMHRRGV